MKNIPLILITVVFTLLSCYHTRTVVVAPPPPPPPQPATYQVFYDDLSPYGQWVEEPEYGYVWIPRVERGWRPYYDNGHWDYTDAGWAWASEYNWGWAPFHYGRWRFDSYYGWSWIPGNQWAPAWVTWRESNDYYGWAPCGPGYDPYDTRAEYPVDHWAFVPRGRVHDAHFRNYEVDHTRVVNVYHNTTIINNTIIVNNNHYSGGPHVKDVEKASGGRVPVYNVRESGKPGSATVKGREIDFYRPAVAEPKGDKNRPAPRTYVPRNEKPKVEPVAPPKSRENVYDPAKSRIDNKDRKVEQPNRQPVEAPKKDIRQEQPQRQPVEAPKKDIRQETPKQQPVETNRRNMQSDKPRQQSIAPKNEPAKGRERKPAEKPVKPSRVQEPKKDKGGAADKKGRD